MPRPLKVYRYTAIAKKDTPLRWFLYGFASRTGIGLSNVATDIIQHDRFTRDEEDRRVRGL